MDIVAKVVVWLFAAVMVLIVLVVLLVALMWLGVIPRPPMGGTIGGMWQAIPVRRVA
jgi:hypothetical protein